MICSTCGREIDGNLSFCTYCGASVAKPQANNFDATVMADPQVLPNAEPSVPAFNNAVPAQAPVAVEDAELKAYESNALMAFIFSIISMVLSNGIGLVFFFLAKGKLNAMNGKTFSFQDPALDARVQSANKKAHLAGIFVKIGLILNIIGLVSIAFSMFGTFLMIIAEML